MQWSNKAAWTLHVIETNKQTGNIMLMIAMLNRKLNHKLDKRMYVITLNTIDNLKVAKIHTLYSSASNNCVRKHFR